MKSIVERWVHEDDEGIVFGYPATVEVDLVKNKEYVLIELMSPHW